MKTFFNFKKHQIPLVFSFLGLLLISSSISLIISAFSYQYLPNTYINNTDISRLSLNQAVNKLTAQKTKIQNIDIHLLADEKLEATPSSTLKPYFDYNSTAQLILDKQKKELNRFLLKPTLFFSNKYFNSQVKTESIKTTNFIDQLNKKIAIKGEDPFVELKISNNENSLIVSTGKVGKEIAVKETKGKIVAELNKQLLANSPVATIEAVVVSTHTKLNQEYVENTLVRAKKFVGKELKFKVNDRTIYLDDRELISLIDPTQEYKDKKIEDLLNDWSKKINREPQDAEFIYDKNTLKVSSFVSDKNGLELKKIETKKLLLATLKKIENDQKYQVTQSLPVKKTPPKITLEETNDLGIKERIGFGESYYFHSIINRVHNVSVTADRVSLTIIPPQQEFSFNKTLGEVSARTGYRSAYVISGGKTVLGDGGGVCQVSSTLFRAVLDAGLKVTKRLQHSYRVSYYELNSQPGFDATVYAGDVDFRFINDTPNHILIFTHTEPENRYMNIEIYGTNDGRTTEIINYKTWDYRRPPAPQYYPTTSLPTGVTKQVDWSVSGIKTEFTHLIKDKNGKTLNSKVYYSNYKPWSAKYMIGI